MTFCSSFRLDIAVALFVSCIEKEEEKVASKAKDAKKSQVLLLLVYISKSSVKLFQRRIFNDAMYVMLTNVNRNDKKGEVMKSLKLCDF